MSPRVALREPRVRTAPESPSESPGRHGDPAAGLLDRFGRRATDMRLSLIDKCNLRCTYCMPAEGLPWLNRDQLLTVGEVRRLVRIGVEILGIRELRLTGGEPLVRKDLEEIIAGIRADHPRLPVALTTNAIGLDRRAAALAEAGLTRVNISLDSVHRETFAKLTRRDQLDAVLTGVQAVADAGLTPLKINAVLVRGVNDAQAPDLLAWALGHGFELRFIEQMPLEAEQTWRREATVTAAETRELLSTRYRLSPTDEDRGGAPAERFDVWEKHDAADSPPRGRVGIIASVTEPFCAACTRTRITAEGRVMSCLFSRQEVDLMDLLRSGADDQAVAQRWADAMWAKPAAHGTDRPGFELPGFTRPERSMSAIGG
ncbi:GTP 3',8-cyclase MoaA [Nesterenkonia alkaliphila]|uniref:GTP 3',8-cyclase n=1 Tax=Nesterenkonia alkaliphila TaxID=1463631 RepID=A0A7K1UJM7_9MICC|nr:GTP 3',8-cyclase MoaA [Nesterenkonia alkaliphila]MVT26687.1 GTP 3',8-cyclase MoaA [Nesterenkonia alkaliphila]GFZ76738.1 cyclic pyranopterin monophosphate synthase [Nesterenkonia alkaliphila]